MPQGVPQFSFLAFSLRSCPDPRLVVFLSPKFVIGGTPAAQLYATLVWQESPPCNVPLGRNSPPFKSPCPSAPLSPEILPIDDNEAPDRPHDDDDEDDDNSPNVLEPPRGTGTLAYLASGPGTCR
jgi:hypothetical protein